MAKQNRLGKIITLPAEVSQRIADGPLERARHIFVDLMAWRGEYVPYYEAVEAEKCRRTSDYIFP